MNHWLFQVSLYKLGFIYEQISLMVCDVRVIDAQLMVRDYEFVNDVDGEPAQSFQYPCEYPCIPCE